MTTQTILDQLTQSLKNKATLADTTTCWDYYSNNFGKNSNLVKTLKNLPKLSAGYRYLVVVGKKGKTQHSPTDLHIFKAKENADIGNLDCLYRNHWYV